MTFFACALCGALAFAAAPNAREDARRSLDADSDVAKASHHDPYSADSSERNP